MQRMSSDLVKLFGGFDGRGQPAENPINASLRSLSKGFDCRPTLLTGPYFQGSTSTTPLGLRPRLARSQCVVVRVVFRGAIVLLHRRTTQPFLSGTTVLWYYGAIAPICSYAPKVARVLRLIGSLVLLAGFIVDSQQTCAWAERLTIAV